MKRTTIILILCWALCLPLVLFARKTTYFEGETVNGQVKTLVEKSYGYKDGRIDSASNNYTIRYTFTESGLLLRREGLGQIVRRTYDSNDRLSHISICTEDGTEYGRTDYFYEDSLLVNYIYRPVTTKKSRSDYEYFATYKTYCRGLLIEQKEVNKSRLLPKETIREHIKYKYDDLKDLIYEEKLSPNGKVTERTQKKYTDHRLTESFTWQKFEGEDLYFRHLYAYNEEGLSSSHKYFVYHYGSTDRIANSWETVYAYEYDSDHRLIEETRTTTYDDWLNAPPRKFVIRYSDFDSMGNWLKKIVDDNGKVNIIVREYEYYQ